MLKQCIVEGILYFRPPQNVFLPVFYVLMCAGKHVTSVTILQGKNDLCTYVRKKAECAYSAT